ncbi:hypothetical protein SZ64_01530 [Erythrobacter sp. SG61-1L]|uniref:hypothetical protein n=1 Tax=Erythrobacter sp. SG61-1L TaxID=1603897 RepID=UPI0006C8E862|nr:hypothetical protein [Erythrobacter sp. SG61-1L]KPL66892.1 hypothetical protein SZ64_01530 [Erythrobacter sp. SG61-1L]
MLLPLTVSLIWLLAMLAAAVCLQDSGRSLRSAVAAALAFAAVLAVALQFNPQPNWIGVLVGVAAGWRLISGPLPRTGSLVAGACAGLAAALQIGGGVDLLPAAAVTGGALTIAFLLARPGRGNGQLRGHALILAALGAPLAGLIGDLLYGWQSATVLSQDAAQSAAPAPPAWAIAIVGLALGAGLLRGMWIRR